MSGRMARTRSPSSRPLICGITHRIGDQQMNGSFVVFAALHPLRVELQNSRVRPAAGSIGMMVLRVW